VFDRRHHLLFVAGGPTGQAYVYNTRTRVTAASYQFGASGSAFINDVTLTATGPGSPTRCTCTTNVSSYDPAGAVIRIASLANYL
jgi:hypothetical protein